MTCTAVLERVCTQRKAGVCRSRMENTSKDVGGLTSLLPCLPTDKMERFPVQLHLRGSRISQKTKKRGHTGRDHYNRPLQAFCAMARRDSDFLMSCLSGKTAWT